MSDQEDASLEAGGHGSRPDADEEVRNRRPGRGTPRIDPPKAINLKENRKENFRLFHTQWKQYSILTRLDQEAEEYRVALLLCTVGKATVPRSQKRHNWRLRQRALSSMYCGSTVSKTLTLCTSASSSTAANKRTKILTATSRNSSI